MTASASSSFQVQSWQELANHFPGLQTIANLELNGDLEFRSYQALATLAVVFSGFRGVVRSATGSGKTLVAAAISASMLPQKTLVLIHGRELVAQTHREFCKFLGEKNVGVITSTEFNPKGVTISSIDTFGFYMGVLPKKKTGVPIMDPKVFASRKDQFLKLLKEQVDMLLFDEVHHGSAETWQKIGVYAEAYYRVGLSGTPLKHDELSDMLMMSLVGPVVFDLDAKWLQARGYLADAKLEVREMDFTTAQTRAYSWQNAQKKMIVENEKRTIQIASDIAEAISSPKTRLLVLTGNSVPLAESLDKEVTALTRQLRRDLGFAVHTTITGTSSTNKVSKAFRDLRDGSIRCVITTKMADEGIDVPNINLLYLVGGGKAYVSTVQRIGRGLRVKDGGEHLLVVDYFTLGNKYTEKHDRKRLKTYEEEGFFNEVEVKRV
jgi:superfamily II DNA or RNA helicase